MEYGSIERELHIDATPDVVYEVISKPEHISRWWPDHADFAPEAGATGTITFGEPGHPDAKTEPITVLETDPPRRFAFRWVAGGDGGALTVTFDLAPSGTGTRLRFAETGFRGRWDGAELAEAYQDHVNGWNHFLPRLAPYVDRLVSSR